MFLRRAEQLELFRKIPLFSELSKRDLNEIAKRTDLVTVKAGRTLSREGELGREFLVIVDGRARVEKGGRLVRRLSAGDYFGEVALIDPGLRTASVVADSDVNLMVLNSRDFMALLDEVRGLAKKILLQFCKYLRAEDAPAAGRP